jgi:hypothetical protein
MFSLKCSTSDYMMFSHSPGHETSQYTPDTLHSTLRTVLASDLQFRSMNCDQTAASADTTTPDGLGHINKPGIASFETLARFLM